MKSNEQSSEGEFQLKRQGHEKRIDHRQISELMQERCQDKEALSDFKIDFDSREKGEDQSNKEESKHNLFLTDHD